LGLGKKVIFNGLETFKNLQGLEPITIQLLRLIYEALKRYLLQIFESKAKKRT